MRSVADVCIPFALQSGMGKNFDLVMAWDEVVAKGSGIRLPNGKTLADVMYYIQIAQYNLYNVPTPFQPTAHDGMFPSAGYWRSDGLMYVTTRKGGSDWHSTTFSLESARTIDYLPVANFTDAEFYIFAAIKWK